MIDSNKSAYYSLIFVFIASISAIALHIERTESFVLGIAYFSAFFSYFWIVRYHSKSKGLLWVTLIAHLLPFFNLPSLSDDIYRFIWDGHLLQAGLDPFAKTPAYYINHQIEILGLSETLYQKLNSPNYYTVYPPFNQLFFWLSAKFGIQNLLISTNIIRAFILLALFGSYRILQLLLIKSQKSPQLAFWFILNPLVILEFSSNIHFEALVIFFVLLGFYFIHANKSSLAGLSIGGAIATKLLPLIFLPAILFNHKWKKGLFITAMAFVFAAISFIPMISSELIINMQSSLGLYFQKFEFNASIYFIIREIGYLIMGYNIIEILGPSLSAVTLVSILLLSYYGAIYKWQLEKTALFSLTIYLLLATTVHPWYILTLIPLGLITGYYYPIFWSLIIFVTYFGYNPHGFELSSNWIVLEYLSLLIFYLVETYIRKRHELVC